METMTGTVIPNKKSVCHFSSAAVSSRSPHFDDQIRHIIRARLDLVQGLLAFVLVQVSGSSTGNMCDIDAAPYPAPQAHHLSTLNVCFEPQINDVTVPVWQQDLGVRGHAEEEEGRVKQEDEEQDPVERCFTPG